MTQKKKSKYIESHWLVFGFQGLIGLLFGWFIMFTGITQTSALVATVASAILAIGIVDLFNLLHRSRTMRNWGFTLILAILDIAISLTLLLTINQNPVWALGLIAGYTIFRGLFEVFVGLKSLTDPTDRFIWVVCGICGIILGFVVLNSGHMETNTFIKIFGTYLMIYGISNLIYGVHNKNEREEQREAWRKAAAKHRRAQKKLTAEQKKNPLRKLFGK